MIPQPESATFSSLELTLTARADNIPVARQAVGAMLVDRVDADMLGDVKTGLTEACMNAVVHAYAEEGDGDFQVTTLVESKRVTIEVRDWGGGIQPRPLASAPGLRIGLPLIAALTDDFEIRSGSGSGTSVTLCFDLEREGGPSAPAQPPPAHAEREAILSLSSTDGSSPSFAAALAMLAARSDLSVDRLSDVQIIGDLLGAAGSKSPDGVQLKVHERGNGIAISVGPLPAGGAAALVERGNLPALGNVFDRMADGWEISEDGGAETLLIEIGTSG